MNKIKAKANDQFSPWQESFLNLVRSFDHKSLDNKPSKTKKQFFTIDNYKTLKDKISRKSLGRTVLNTSKINLRSGNQDNLQEHLIIQQRSSRYQGPRITFYSKMNPKCPNESKQHLRSNQKKSLGYSFYKQEKSFLTRDSSIKYLDILEEGEGVKSKQRVENRCPIFPISTDKSLIIPRRRQDDWINMKRLKYLFNNRKLSNNY